MLIGAYKTPNEIKDYTIDWTETLADGEIILMSAWSAAAGIGINTPDPVIVIGGTATTVWLSGGVSGNSYLVTNTIITNGGREYEESFICYVNPINYTCC